MRKLLTSPGKMSLGQAEHQIYESALKYVADLALNLMAIKVENHPEDFLGWCQELHRLCKHKMNMDLLEPAQLKPLKKLQETLELGVSVSQLKMMRIAPWPIFTNVVEQQKTLHAIDERMRLLTYVKGLEEKTLAEMVDEDRMTFCGKHTAQHDISVYDFDVEWFASTRGAKSFHTLLQSHPQLFDQALAHIPLTGDVEYVHYQGFVNSFKAIFNEHTDKDKPSMVAATRLLAMRRPDVFVALANNKIDPICQGLNVTKFNNQDFDSYWHELIMTLQTCPWYTSPEPEEQAELTLWQVRAALIDVFFFADQSLAENSNYIRMRDKPTKTKVGVAKSVKRSKESAEQIVDKALAADDVPEYLLDMRNSLVNSVKDGKPVEQAISLMRSIFG
ncbi:hypothetical protein [Thalassotalea aquiviva]|uniref:hypothetical protein n=1 Tax=Thalassotalea aquiviva TaxID=3242415 RepID=UPI00352B5F1B